MEQVFKSERKLVGQGKMAKVYLWNGFAYKCFRSDYPAEWIDYEMWIQDIISKTDLPIIKYHKSEIPHSIKMDFIDGVPLADRIRHEKYKNGLEDLLSLFSKVHEIKDIDLPRLNPSLIKDIDTLSIDVNIKNRAKEYIASIPDENTLCHLDFHFLNLMYSNDKYYMIDWINAKIGNPIYDFARTYVIMYEFAYRLSKKYINMVNTKCGFDPIDVKKAIYVMAVQRLSECNSEKINQLIDECGVNETICHM